MRHSSRKTSLKNGTTSCKDVDREKIIEPETTVGFTYSVSQVSDGQSASLLPSPKTNGHVSRHSLHVVAKKTLVVRHRSVFKERSRETNEESNISIENGSTPQLSSGNKDFTNKNIMSTNAVIAASARRGH